MSSDMVLPGLELTGPVRGQIERAIQDGLEGRLEAALAELNTLLQAAALGDADRAYAHFARGNLLVRLGLHQEALMALRTAASLAPEEASILFNLGLEELAAGFGPEGRGHVERAAALGHSRAQATLTALAAGSNVAFNPPPKRGADIVTDHMDRARTATEEGRLEDALVEYGQAIKLSPMAKIHTLRGLVLQQLERNEEAVADFTRAIALDPEDAVALGSRGALLGQLDRLDEALADFARAVALQPGTGWLHLNKAGCHAQRGDMPEFTTHVLEAFALGDMRALTLLERVTGRAWTAEELQSGLLKGGGRRAAGPAARR